MAPAVDRLNPVGRDPAVTDQPLDEMVAPPAAPDVVAAMVTVEMAVPELLVNGPGLVTVTVLLMVQVKVVLAAKACESVAVTVTEHEQAVVGVPLMPPVVELIDNPAGRPDAANVTALVTEVSCGALMVRALMALPDTLVCVPGLVTDRLSTFQVRVIDPLPPAVWLPPPLPPPEL